MRSSLASQRGRLGPWTSTRRGARSYLEDMGQNGDLRAEKVKLVIGGERQTLLM
jgi:hypothetical protein